MADGQKAATADQPMGTKRHTNVGNASARTHYAAAGQVQDASLIACGSVSGTNTITASLSPAITGYAAGMLITLTPANSNTGAVTLALNSLTALDVLKGSGDALAPGDLVAGVPAYLLLDSGADDWILLNPQHKPIKLNSQTGNYTCVAADANNSVLHPSGGGSGDTFTIPANASVAYETGTTLTFVNGDSNSITIAITSDTMTLAGTTTTGSRTLGQNGVATALKIGSTSWLISGTALI